MTDAGALADLARFARVERDSGDLEPWASVLGQLHHGGLGDEETLWLVKLYNAFDDLGSAWSIYRRWPTPARWAVATDANDAARYPLTNERRNLRAGKVLAHLGDYVGHLAGEPQALWLARGIVGEPRANFVTMLVRLRRIWGVGRQTAFEWAEFLAKVMGWPLEAPGAFLWESEGPRRSLQRIYGNPRPSPEWLDARADECRAWLADQGVALSWEDFETVICDFNVMRDGRYYPGRHLAALRGEINEMAPRDAEVVLAAFRQVIPQPWADIAPGVNKELMPLYRDTGRMVTGP